MARALARTPISPNQITWARLGFGIAAALAFAVGTSGAIYTGAALFVVSTFLDRADGELARASGRGSAWGHRFDLIADSVSNALAFIGIGIGAHVNGGFLGAWAIPAGVIAGLAVASILWLVMRAEAVGGPRAGELKPTAGFDPDDAMLVVPVALLFGLDDLLILAAAAGAPAFAVHVFWTLRRRLKLSRATEA